MTLSDFLKRSEQLLLKAATERDHPARTPVLTTVAGQIPFQRMVVLRAYDPQLREALFYTDLRSNKVEQLRRNPRAGLLFWDPDERLQIRIRGQISIEMQSPRTDRHFEELPPRSLVAYATQLAPGTPISEETVARLEECSAVRENFALLCFQADAFDVLELTRSLHRRAGFQKISGIWQRTWLVP